MILNLIQTINTSPALKNPQTDWLDMQPLKLLINKIRDTSLPSSGIRGAPQIGKVYRSGNCKVFGVLWQSSNGKPHYQGRPIVDIQSSDR